MQWNKTSVTIYFKKFSNDAIILTGPKKNSIVHLPRIDLRTDENNYTFILTRRQFPVRLAFAMTINKSQGQSLSKTAIYLSQSVFSHGKLFVSMSRGGDPQNTKMFLTTIPGKQGIIDNGNYTANIVYSEALV